MALLPQEIIRKKRDGAALGDGEIEALVAGIADGSLGEGQVGAFAMAAFLCGMNAQETVALTRAMTASGRRLDWRRSEEHTSELQSLMRISYAVFCLKQKYNIVIAQNYIFSQIGLI